MDMNQVYVTLDEMFAGPNTAQAEDYLIEMMKQAGREEDYQSLIMLLNEMIGYCRETGQKEKSIAYSSQVIELAQQMGLEGTVPYATTLLNVANALRAAGRLEEAYRFYMEVFPIYDANLRPDDFYYASLYNNLSLLLQEMGDYDRAIECLQKALELAMSTQGKEFEVYVTHANIASTLCKLAQKEAEREKAAGMILGTDVLPRSGEIAMDACEHAKEAIEGFMHHQSNDQHMAAAYTAYADAQLLMGNTREAVRYLKDAAQMVKECLGETEAYERIVEKYSYASALDEKRRQEKEREEREQGDKEYAFEKLALANKMNGKHTPGLELSKAYYEAYGKKMLFDGFGEYLDRIAVGLLGEGSECLGFDDGISTDHDFGPGFCIWVTKETYDEIGFDLQNAYDSLPKEFGGYAKCESVRSRSRRGVFVIDDFFEGILQRNDLPVTPEQWLSIPEYALLAATSGEIFSDPEGIVTKKREQLLSYYPDEALRRLIAQHMTLFSQYGQYNYARMLKRGDRAAATFMIVKATEHAMHLCYLLNRKYAPHDKWLLRGMEEFEVLPMAEDIMTALLNNPDVHKEDEGVDRIALVEKLAGMFLGELKKQGFIPESANDTYLAAYGEIVAFGGGAAAGGAVTFDESGAGSGGSNGVSGGDAKAPGMDKETPDDGSRKSDGASPKEEYSHDDLVDTIVKMEFNAFDEVKNEGGRADCQDNWPVFSVMRKSQYLTWTDEMLGQYIYDFKTSMDKGWNPITEKYARMMKSTAPEKYRQMEDVLPEIPREKEEIIEEIVKVQVKWMEEFAERYPKMASRARTIHTSQDTAYDTSYETYLRGEVSTYSDDMLVLYGRFIAALAIQGKSLTYLIMENTAKLYGFPDLDTAERSL